VAAGLFNVIWCLPGSVPRLCSAHCCRYSACACSPRSSFTTGCRSPASLATPPPAGAAGPGDAAGRRASRS
jgi:hypothetical protein